MFLETEGTQWNLKNWIDSYTSTILQKKLARSKHVGIGKKLCLYVDDFFFSPHASELRGALGHSQVCT